MYLEEKTKVNGSQAVHCKHPSQFPNGLPGVKCNQYNLHRVSPKKFVSKGGKLLPQSISMWLINHLLSQTDPDASHFVVNVAQLHICLKLNKPNIIFHKNKPFSRKGGDFLFQASSSTTKICRKPAYCGCPCAQFSLCNFGFIFCFWSSDCSVSCPIGFNHVIRSQQYTHHNWLKWWSQLGKWDFSCIKA